MGIFNGAYVYALWSGFLVIIFPHIMQLTLEKHYFNMPMNHSHVSIPLSLSMRVYCNIKVHVHAVV